MALITTYQNFINRVDELGFMTLSQALEGLTSLGSETSPSAWHTGDPATDPWLWKDQAAQERRLAYACCLGRAKGFIAPRMYPLFYTAFHPALPMEDRWTEGNISQVTWKTWGLFEKGRSLNTSEIRNELAGSLKSSASQIEASLDALQGEFYLTTAGVRQKVSKSGKLYGWPATVFERVVDWAPLEWLVEAKNWDPRGAREAILDIAVESNPGVIRNALAKFLRMH